MSESVLPTDLKEYLRAGREEIRARHVAGALGGQVATALTDLNDRVVIEAYQRAMQQASGATRTRLLEDLALVAVGGTGRGDTAPYSDVDLLFLLSVTQGDATRAASPVSRLTDRELEVFECIGQGLGASEIAKKLRLSVKTIESYQAKLNEKLHVKDSYNLCQHALHWVEHR